MAAIIREYFSRWGLQKWKIFTQFINIYLVNSVGLIYTYRTYIGLGKGQGDVYYVWCGVSNEL